MYIQITLTPAEVVSFRDVRQLRDFIWNAYNSFESTAKIANNDAQTHSSCWIQLEDVRIEIVAQMQEITFYIPHNNLVHKVAVFPRIPTVEEIVELLGHVTRNELPCNRCGVWHNKQERDGKELSEGYVCTPCYLTPL